MQCSIKLNFNFIETIIKWNDPLSRPRDKQSAREKICFFCSLNSRSIRVKYSWIVLKGGGGDLFWPPYWSKHFFWNVTMYFSYSFLPLSLTHSSVFGPQCWLKKLIDVERETNRGNENIYFPMRNWKLVTNWNGRHLKPGAYRELLQGGGKY